MITPIGAGAQVAAAEANVTPPYPAGYSAVDDDFALVVVTGRALTLGTKPATPPGWTFRTQSEHDAGTRKLELVTYHRVLVGGAGAPTFVIPADWSSAAAGGITAQMVVYAGVDLGTPFDLADVLALVPSQSTWQPPGLTTNSADARVLSIVNTNDANALGLLTANGFTAVFHGAAYDTTVGGNMSVGLADIAKATAGAQACPTWEETVSTGPWVGITCALRAAVGGGGGGAAAITALRQDGY